MNQKIVDIITKSEDTFNKFAIFKPTKDIELDNLYPSTSKVWDDGVPVTKALFREPGMNSMIFIKDHTYLIASYHSEEDEDWETYYVADMTAKNLVWFTTATIENEIIDEYHPLSDEAIKREEEFSKFLTDNSIELVQRNDILLAMLNGVRF